MKGILKRILITIVVTIGVLVILGMIYNHYAIQSLRGGPLADSTEVLRYTDPKSIARDSAYYVGSGKIYFMEPSGGPFVLLTADSESFVAISQTLAKDNTQLFFNEASVDINVDMRPFEVVSCPDTKVYPSDTQYPQVWSLWDAKGRVYEIKRTGYEQKRIDGEFIPRKYVVELVLDSSKTIQEERDRGCSSVTPSQTRPTPIQ
jgi:hypothetical protein